MGSVGGVEGKEGGTKAADGGTPVSTRMRNHPVTSIPSHLPQTSAVTNESSDLGGSHSTTIFSFYHKRKNFQTFKLSVQAAHSAFILLEKVIRPGKLSCLILSSQVTFLSIKITDFLASPFQVDD